MIRTFIEDYFVTIRAYINVRDFAKAHQIWRGFTRHRLVLAALALVGIFLGLVLWSTVYNWWSELKIESTFDAGMQAAGLVGDLASTGYNFAFAGAYKYMVLIIMELLIFHVALRTNEIVTGESEELTASLFLSAQIRMIKVSVFVFMMELVASVIIGIGLGILGLTLIKPVLLFVVQCFFLGFALIDNYNEINKLSIRDSFSETKLHPGASFGIGIILYLLIMIPLVGPIIGPMVGAVAATLTMYAIETHQKIDVIVENCLEQ